MTDINVGAISEALNNKVDLNQMNTNQQGLSYASGWGMPSSRYTNLTLGASGASYTAPANGWFAVGKKSNATNQHIIMKANEMLTKCVVPTSNTQADVIMPVSKGSTLYVGYTVGGETVYFIFVYAQGEQN